MILRKPYAFLIKHFQKINFVLLLLAIFTFIKNREIYAFVKEYIELGIYNSSVDSIGNYISTIVLIVLFVILILSAILIILLKHKDKPIITYSIITIEYLFMLVMYFYTIKYFGELSLTNYDVASAMIVRDLIFISSLPQYIVFILLLIRTLGLDLKSFGFREDKEFLEAEEDREEVEVAVGFDYDKAKRTFKQKIRYLKYFFLEHKFVISILLTITVLFSAFSIYNYVFVENKIYKMGYNFNSNSYTFKVNATYITNKDYAGNIITNENTYYVLVDVDVKNNLSTERTLDIEKFFLSTSQKYYIPEVRFNTYFEDMANLFKKESIKGMKSANYILIFEIDKPKKDENFILSYQDATTNDTKMKKVRIDITDISNFKTKGKAKLMEDLLIPVNPKVTKEMNVYEYQLLDEVKYTYKTCEVYDCYMEESRMIAGANKKILYLRTYMGDDSNSQFLNFTLKYGKIKYKVLDTWYTGKLINKAPRSYRGNYLYFDVSGNVQNASEIELYFTIRQFQYFYKLK